MTDTLLKTPLYDCHVEAHARMVDFAGWSMPVMYASILDEARAVRSAFGMFDISHMGRVDISGAGALPLLQRLTTNDVAALRASEAQYSLLTNEQGGVIDDIIVYRRAVDQFLVVINAGNTGKDLDWIAHHMPGNARLDNRTSATAMIAVQGPEAPQAVAELSGTPDVLNLDRFQYADGAIAGAPATLCRTGYTGEDGFEVIVGAADARRVWTALANAGATPCGLGARDTLRIEAGYPLYGHEIDEETTPVEAGLMWVVRLDKGEFVGREAIEGAKAAAPPRRRLVGLVSPERQVPRQGYTILSEDNAIGAVTSGTFSPTCGHCVAMGYVRGRYSRPGTPVAIQIRDRRIDATVVPKKALLSS